MKKYLLSSSVLGTAMLLAMVAGAAAADLPVYTKAPPPAPPTWSWTGFYIGVQGGSGWGTNELNETSVQLVPVTGVIPVVPNSASASYGLNGWHGGGTAGYNWQAGQIVFGVEGDLSGANISGRGDCTHAVTFPIQQAGCHTNMPWFGTLTGRLGVAVDHALVYVKGGGAWAHFDHDSTGAFFTTFPVIPGFASAVGENRTGVTAGVGVEYAFWHNWSAKIEYDYMDFGTRNLAFVSVPIGPFTTINREDVSERVHVIKAGLNYRFDWGGSRY